ncbi:MAG TPA: hypothetical protein PLK37_10685 [Terricaulis sp.]|nr:hypothetical protein [Terricaulis sp.]
MNRLAVGVSVAALAALAAACAGFNLAPQPTPSPRAECAPTSVTIYFTEESATLQPLADPLLARLMQQVSDCTNAGGELRGLTITAYPDARGSRSSREAEMRLRAQRVQAALVQAGAPADKIRIVRPRGETGVMTRRAEVSADLF